MFINIGLLTENGIPDYMYDFLCPTDHDLKMTSLSPGAGATFDVKPVDSDSASIRSSYAFQKVDFALARILKEAVSESHWA